MSIISKQEKDCTTTENVLAPFNPICERSQRVVLKLLQLDSNDVLFDLGCGDGRLLQLASNESKCKCVGIELNEEYVNRGKKRIQDTNNLNNINNGDDDEQLIEIRHGDVLQELSKQDDINDFFQNATAVYVYLLPKGLQKIRPYLETKMKMTKHFRVVSYIFSIPQWNPIIVDRTSKGEVAIYLYDSTSIPA